MLKHFKTIAIFVFLITSFETLLAQNGRWQFIEKSDNVYFYWRYKEEYNNQYITEMKVENENGSKVEVSFRPSFRCGSTYVDNQGHPTFTIKPHGKQSGEFAGLLWYPCGSKTPPSDCRLKNVVVKRL
jgi:hypothetical protein